MEIDKKLFDQIYQFILDHTHDYKDPRFTATSTLRERAEKFLPLLPAPTDPDLIEARKLCAEYFGAVDTNYLNGSRDHWESVQLTLAAIKRGRELQGLI